MSLEAILEANTAALQSHTAVMQALLERLGAAAPAALESVTAKPAAETKAKPQAEKPAAQAKAEPQKQPETKGEAQAEAVTYEQIKPLIIKLGATKGREVAAALLQEFGVTRGPDLKAEQYGAVFVKLQGLLS